MNGPQTPRDGVPEDSDLTADGTPARALRADNVTAGYGLARMRRTRWRGWIDNPTRPGGELVLENVSLTVPAGAITGLSGPSGSGKTTLARILTGLIEPASGTVTCDGEPLQGRRGRLTGDVQMLFQSPRRSVNPSHTLARIVAEPLLLRQAANPTGRERTVVTRSTEDGRTTTPQAQDAVQFHWSSQVRDEITGAGALTTDEAVRAACRRVELTEDLLERRPTEVSLGQLQRAALARLLVAGPRYLVCDEATAMLDAATTALVVDVLREEAQAGAGVLVISHDQALLRAWADRVHDLRDCAEPPGPGDPATA